MTFSAYLDNRMAFKQCVNFRNFSLDIATIFVEMRKFY